MRCLRLFIKHTNVASSGTALCRRLRPETRFASAATSGKGMGSLDAADASPAARPSKVLLHCGEACSAAWPAVPSDRLSLTAICYTDWSAKESWLRGLRDVGLDVELWPDLTCFDDVAFVVCWYAHIAQDCVRLQSVNRSPIDRVCMWFEANHATCADRNPPDELFSKVNCGTSANLCISIHKCFTSLRLCRSAETLEQSIQWVSV